MKRPIFIIIGAVIVFILLAIWVYMLFFGTPNEVSEQFADFEFGDTTDPTTADVPPEQNGDDPVVNVTGPDPLRQLTTKPVIAYQEIRNGSSSPDRILYMEAGTGHIYSINKETGEEKRVSGTTIPLSQAGAISSDGGYIMVRSGAGRSSETIVGHLSSTSDEVITTTMTEPVTDFTATKDGVFLYAVQNESSVVAKAYNPTNDQSEMLFTIPFREAAIAWGDTAADAHYVYPKASSELEGYLYRAENGQLTRLPISGYGLSAVGNNDYVIYSKRTGESYETFLYDVVNVSDKQLSRTLIPEKCRAIESVGHQFMCATEITDFSHNTPDMWYQGVTVYKDDLWQMDAALLVNSLLVSPETESGRTLDMVGLQPTIGGDIYFTNKTDQTLWLYETPETTTSNNAVAE